MHVHWGVLVKDTGLVAYYECRCLRREAVVRSYAGEQPVDEDWLDGGEFSA